MRNRGLHITIGLLIIKVMDFFIYLKQEIKIKYLKLYRYLFIPKLINYNVPSGERLFEMNLVTGVIKKAEYKNYANGRIFIKNENCIYDSAINIHNVKPKFDSLIHKALNLN